LIIVDAPRPESLFCAGGVRFDVARFVILETSMTKNAEGAAGDLNADLAALREDVARLAETLSKLVQRQTHAAGLGVSDAVGDAKDTIASTAADARKHVRAARSEIEASIERNPLTAALIAFGVGMLLGMMSRSRG
jgi:ElaB/YqjD/DUF883 family membrane-anchored ribosome-binding protein